MRTWILFQVTLFLLQAASLHQNGINLEIVSKFCWHCRNLLLVSILKSILNSSPVKNYCFFINLEITSKAGHCQKLLVVSILKSLVDSATVENYLWYHS
jgi:hypothetical protein